MGRGMSRTARLMAAAACVLAISACKDVGLKDRNLPLGEARDRQFRYSAYDAMPDNLPVSVNGQHWLGSSEIVRITPSLLIPIGEDGLGTMLYAVKAGNAPYDRVFASAGGNQWRPFLRVN